MAAKEPFVCTWFMKVMTTREYTKDIALSILVETNRAALSIRTLFTIVTAMNARF
jgi:hypothetical protein